MLLDLDLIVITRDLINLEDKHLVEIMGEILLSLLATSGVMG